MNQIVDMENPRYTIQRELESGAQGTVVSATDNHSNTTVAVKIIDITTTKGQRGFLTEVMAHEILKRGRAKSICQIQECIQVPDKYGLIVMKQYESDLFDFTFNNNTPLTTEQVKNLFRGICEAVKDMHLNGLAHLDIKPENILLDSEGKPHLCDFGSSYFKKKRRRRFSMIERFPKNVAVEGIEGRGTKTYAAPEVFSGKAYNPYKADIYSLGMVLHVLLTGYFPEDTLESSKSVVDPECYKLLSHTINQHPEKRLGINEVLHHKWLKKVKPKKRLVFSLRSL